MGIPRFSLLALIVSVSSCCLMWAQATAQITGTVRDQAGRVLPGAAITVTQTDTGFTKSATTDKDGVFVLQNLAIGPYQLEAVLTGFRTYLRTGILLEVNSNPVINIELEPGQATSQVQVQANAPLAQ